MLGWSCHWAMSIPKVKGALLHLCGFGIQNGTLHIISGKRTFAEGMCDCYTWVSFRVHVFAYIKKICFLKQGPLCLDLAQGSENYVCRPTSNLWSVLVHKLQMIFIFWKTRILRRLCDRNCRWLAKPEVFTTWPFTEKNLPTLRTLTEDVRVMGFYRLWGAH